MGVAWNCVAVGAIVVIAGMATTVSARCECSDVRPRVAHDGPPLPFGCADQRRFGKCNETFMFTTIVELPAGYCQISCDRCDCCSTFKELATVNGLGEMIDLMEASGMDPEEYHANPAWMGTVLVPRPGAFANWLSAQGWSLETMLGDPRKMGILQDTLKVHILPPVQPIDALWTAPFFTSGVEVSTMAVPSLSGNKRDGATTLSGPWNTATLQDGGREFCKGYMYVIDDVLRVAPMDIPPPTNIAPAEEQEGANTQAGNNTAQPQEANDQLEEASVPIVDGNNTSAQPLEVTAAPQEVTYQQQEASAQIEDGTNANVQSQESSAPPQESSAQAQGPSAQPQEDYSNPQEASAEAQGPSAQPQEDYSNPQEASAEAQGPSAQPQEGYSSPQEASAEAQGPGAQEDYTAPQEATPQPPETFAQTEDPNTLG